MRTALVRLRILGLVLCALVLAGCAIESPYMTKLETPRAYVANPEAATVVFIRPSNYAGRLQTVIMDQSGRFLGECWGKTYFIVSMPPGHYQFISWGEGTPVLDANVEPGRIYYVEVGTTIGAWTARARLFGVGPQRESWAELPEWLGKSTMLIPDQAAGQAYLRARGADTAEVLAKGRATWDDYDAEARQKRSITPADGVPLPVRPRFE